MKITTKQQLRELYDQPSGRAKNKVLHSLEEHAINFINKSPFLVMSTIAKNGAMDASPRGGVPGFVNVLDNKTLIIPDSKGNNRLDSLSNIIETGTVGLLFLIPGVDETLRINGKAYISTDKKYLVAFNNEKNIPKACVIITIDELFLHCAKALMRSKLWRIESQIKRSELPTMGQMLKDQLGEMKPAETQEQMVQRYTKDL